MSPIHGWESKEKEINEENVLPRPKSLHKDDQINNDEDEKSEQVLFNGDSSEKKEDNDELEGMRADGRIDASALNNEGQEVTVDEQGVTDEKEEKNENVAQENS